MIFCGFRMARDVSQVSTILLWKEEMCENWSPRIKGWCQTYMIKTRKATLCAHYASMIRPQISQPYQCDQRLEEKLNCSRGSSNNNNNNNNNIIIIIIIIIIIPTTWHPICSNSLISLIAFWHLCCHSTACLAPPKADNISTGLTASPRVIGGKVSFCGGQKKLGSHIL